MSIYSYYQKKAKKNERLQYLTLVIPIANLTDTKKKLLSSFQKEFTQCIIYFIKKSRRHNTTSPYKLHNLCYKTARKKFKLSSMTVQTAIDRAIAIQRTFWDRVKKWKRTSKPAISDLIPVHLRQDSYKLLKTSNDTWMIKFATRPKRKKYLVLPLITRPYILRYLQNNSITLRSAEIYCSDDKWTLSLSIKIPFQLKFHKNIIGVDLGVKQWAVLSNGIFFSGKPVLQIRRKQFIKKSIHKNIKYSEHNQITNFNHLISRKIVKIALQEKANLAIEDLTGLRERVIDRSFKPQPCLTHWTYKQLLNLIQYKATLAGIKVILVESKDTSITCSRCEHKDEDNRIKYNDFRCLSCGFELHADLNAARNIAKRGNELLESEIK